MPKLHDVPSVEQVSFTDSKLAKTELVEDSKNPLRILRRRANQEIDIARESGMSMERHRVPTDDEVFNVLRVQ